MPEYTPELRAKVDAAMAKANTGTWDDFHYFRSSATCAYPALTAHIDAQAERIAELEAENARLREAKDGAYMERNRLVALVASLFPSGTKRTAIEGWSDDWHGCVYIDLPSGQASWHYHDSQAWLFAHLPPYSGEWDGHTTEQKYERIAAALKDTAQ